MLVKREFRVSSNIEILVPFCHCRFKFAINRGPPECKVPGFRVSFEKSLGLGIVA